MLQKIKDMLAKVAMVYTLALNVCSEIRDIVAGIKKSLPRKTSKASEKSKK